MNAIKTKDATRPIGQAPCGAERARIPQTAAIGRPCPPSASARAGYFTDRRGQKYSSASRRSKIHSTRRADKSLGTKTTTLFVEPVLASGVVDVARQCRVLAVRARADVAAQSMAGGAVAGARPYLPWM
jgi:hypothetical protein